ncbi:MAG: hypothetical protein IPJ88_03565 [Myxococcales bacterium]|nr:MAG: hypothetical protein IPJ88_03565 [Myxococcales bacterium]
MAQMRGDEQRRLSQGRHPWIKRHLEQSIAYLKEQTQMLEAEITTLLEANSTLGRRASLLQSFKGIAQSSAACLLSDFPELGTLAAKGFKRKTTKPPKPTTSHLPM